MLKRLLAALAVLALLAGGVLYFRSQVYFEVPCCEMNRKLALTSPPLAGADVEELQLRLRTLGLYGGPINGIYGSETVQAVKDLQLLLNLEVTGEVELWLWPLMFHGEEITQGVNREKPTGEIHIEIDLDRVRLTIFSDGEPHASFPIARGRPSTPSPIGEWRIVNKGHMPSNAFGTRWMGLNVPWGVYGVHGTNAPFSIGNAASAGCIRMYNRDVELIYGWIPIGTKVVITGTRWKTVRQNFRLGNTGQDVVWLQQALRNVGYCPGDADGRFGRDTLEQVRLVQELFGLETDGAVDETLLWLLRLP
jgi:peptidoglycan hydrolase-like protein with peptidoglycan-binding domain